MSGPWDRPSPDRDAPGPDEGTAERPATDPSATNAWPANDLWPDERPAAGSGWDDWSTLPPPDDFVLDDRAPTLGDPWAESWATDEPAGPAPDRSAEPEPAQAWSAPTPATDRWEETPTWSPPVDDPPVHEPPVDQTPVYEPPVHEPPIAETPVAEPPVDETPVYAPPAYEVPIEEPVAPPSSAFDSHVEPEPDWANATVEPEVDAPTIEPEAAGPFVAPWQPSDDPWGMVAEPTVAEPEAVETISDETAAGREPAWPEFPEVARSTAALPVADADTEREPATVEPEPEPEPDADSPGMVVEAERAAEEEPEPASGLGGWRRDFLPSWLSGRTSEAEPEVGEQADVAEGPDVEAASEPIASDAADDTASQDQPIAVAEPDVAAVSEPSHDEPATPPAAAAPEPTFADDTDPEELEAAADLESIPSHALEPGRDDEPDVAEPRTVVSTPDEDAGQVPSGAGPSRDPRFDAWLGVLPGTEPAEDAEPEQEAAAFGAEDGWTEERPPAVREPVVDTRVPEIAWPWAAEAPVVKTVAPDDVAEDHADDAGPSEDEPVPTATADWPLAERAGMEQPPATEADEDASPAETPEPEPHADAQAPVDHGPTPSAEWPLDGEESDEHTRVLPTDWSPPPPAPPPSPTMAAATPGGAELTPQAAPARTVPTVDADRELEEETEAGASTAEQAVPWLIGFILLLAGMVIVLLALIFAGDASLGGGSASPSPSLAAALPSPTPPASALPSGAPAASGAPSAAATVAPTPGASPVGGPRFGALEMVYQGRSTALAPIYLLQRDFTTAPQPEVLAQDPSLDLRRFAWATDGSRGAGLYSDLLLSIEPGTEKRQLADGIATVTFGQDSATVYAVRITQSGANDVAAVLRVGYATADATEITRVTYPRPPSTGRAALQEAQYEDDGGPVRLFWMEDNHLRLWVLNGGMWEIDPADGSVTEPPRRPPMLWSPDGRNHVRVTEADGVTTLTRIDMDGNELGATEIEGLVSHLRWSSDSDRVVFTLGRSGANGGVLQDLFLWDPAREDPPTQITDTGAAFGAEWKGARVRWREDPGET